MTDRDLGEAWEGEYKFVPNGAYIVFPKETVQEMFQHGHPGSTRKTMSNYSPGMVIGWEAEEVTAALDEYDPSRAWPRTKGSRTRTHPQATRKSPTDRRKKNGQAEAD